MKSYSPKLGGRLPRIALMAMATLLATCALLDAPDDDPYVFSHRQHTVDGELDCSVCHKQNETGRPSMPEPQLCLLCHKEGDAEKPQSRRIHVLFRDDVFQATHAARLEEEIIFDHAAHVARNDDCTRCHVDIERNTRITEENAITMEECMDCHAREARDQSCSVCHTEIDELWQPPSHQRDWIQLHGRDVRMSTTVAAQRCDLCHTESSCVTCHSEQKPRNHDSFWRLRGHGTVAAIDRQNCAACHREDFCVRCHEETRPLSHIGSFGSPSNTHCFGCHVSNQDQGCVTCHKSTPSHFLAPPKPPNHNPASNCRLCHGVGASLVHVDDGSDCNLCHN